MNLSKCSSSILPAVLLSLLFVSGQAFADSAATLTCTGQNIILEERSPYLGENSPAAQSLYILKSVDNEQEAMYTAYFLDFQNTDVSGPNNGEYGGYTTYASAKNSVGGRFDLVLSAWTDVGDGTVIKMEAHGDITYSHGPLKGRKEKINCIKE